MVQVGIIPLADAIGASRHVTGRRSWGLWIPHRQQVYSDLVAAEYSCTRRLHGMTRRILHLGDGGYRDVHCSVATVGTYIGDIATELADGWRRNLADPGGNPLCR